MAGKLKISEDFYPSDRDVYDLIISQKLSIPKLQKYLKSRGIFCQSKDRNFLASSVCSVFFDADDLDEVLTFSKVREDKVKISTVYFTMKNKGIEDIRNIFSGDFIKDLDLNKNVRMPSNVSNISYDKESETITFSQPFYKVDFGKSALLQREDHLFGFSIVKKDQESFELRYFTSAVESNTYIAQVVEKLERHLSDDDIFLEVLLDNFINAEQWNEFFDNLLKSSKLGVRFQAAKQVKLQLPDMDDDEEDDVIDQDAEGENDQEDKDKSSIKTLTVSGKDLLEHKDVKEYRKEGYGVKSVTAYFEE